MTMDDKEIETWAAAWVDAQQDPMLLSVDDHPHWWAVARFMEPLDDGVTSDDCWAAILNVLSRKPPANVVGVLAAGPLEDLIEYHGSQVIERIELEARRNPAFRHLLGGVWKSGEPDIWLRVEMARGTPW